MIIATLMWAFNYLKSSAGRFLVKYVNCKFLKSANNTNPCCKILVCKEIKTVTII